MTKSPVPAVRGIFLYAGRGIPGTAKSGGLTSSAISYMGTSKNQFEKGKWVECAECDESRRSKAVCLTRRCNTMLQSEITGDGMDAVASEISLVE